jgi:hypothetical protein
MAGKQTVYFVVISVCVGCSAGLCSVCVLATALLLCSSVCLHSLDGIPHVTGLVVGICDMMRLLPVLCRGKCVFGFNCFDGINM